MTVGKVYVSLLIIENWRAMKAGNAGTGQQVSVLENKHFISEVTIYCIGIILCIKCQY